VLVVGARLGVHYGVQVGKQPADGRHEHRDLDRDCLPHRVAVHDVVVVDQDVAEPDDLGESGDALRDRRVVASETVERLADDLELAIDGERSRRSWS
jgi:hypothetical protein